MLSGCLGNIQRHVGRLNLSGEIPVAYCDISQTTINGDNIRKHKTVTIGLYTTSRDIRKPVLPKAGAFLRPRLFIFSEVLSLILLHTVCHIAICILASDGLIYRYRVNIDMSISARSYRSSVAISKISMMTTYRNAISISRNMRFMYSKKNKIKDCCWHPSCAGLMRMQMI